MAVVPFGRRQSYNSTESVQSNIGVIQIRTAVQRRSYCLHRGRTAAMGMCWVAGFVQCFCKSFISPGWVIYLLVVKVPYLHNINSISNCCTGFPILGFIRGFPYPKYCVHILCDVVNVSQYLYSTAILVNEIHLWFPVTN